MGNMQSGELVHIPAEMCNEIIACTYHNNGVTKYYIKGKVYTPDQVVALQWPITFTSRSNECPQKYPLWSGGGCGLLRGKYCNYRDCPRRERQAKKLTRQWCEANHLKDYRVDSINNPYTFYELQCNSFTFVLTFYDDKVAPIVQLEVAGAQADLCHVKTVEELTELYRRLTGDNDRIFKEAQCHKFMV